MWLVGPFILFTFLIVFQADSYQYWGDKYHSVLSSQYLFSQFRSSSFIQPLWRDDILSGNLWLVSLPTVPFMFDNIAARLFHLSPFGIDLVGNLAGYSVAAGGMYLYLRGVMVVSAETATATSVLFAASGFILSVWTGWAHSFVITGLLPLLLVMSHKLNRSIVGVGSKGEVFISWAGLSILFYVTAAVDSLRTLPIILLLVIAYCTFVFRVGRSILLVMLAMTTGLVLYCPWLWLFWDATRVSQRIIPGFVHPASFEIGHLFNEMLIILKRMATGFNVYGVSIPVVLVGLLGMSHYQQLKNEWCGEKRILWFVGAAFCGCFIMEAFAPQINELKKGIPYVNGYDVVRFDYFASLFLLVVTAWVMDKVLLCPDSRKLSCSHLRGTRLAIAATAILFAAQVLHMTHRISQLPASIYPQNLILYGYVLLYTAITFLLLLHVGCTSGAFHARLWAESRYGRTLCMSFIGLSILFQFSVTSYRLGIDTVHRGDGDEPIMTYRERFAIPEDIALLKQVNPFNDRVVDLTRPYNRVLSTAGLTVLPLAGLSTPEGYNMLFPRWYHQFIANGVNGTQSPPTRWVQVGANHRTNFEALKLLGVRYVLAHTGASISGYTPVLSHEPSRKTIYAAESYVGPAFLSPNMYCASSDGEALKIIHAADYKDLVTRAILVAPDPEAEKLCSGTHMNRRNGEPSIPDISVQRGLDMVNVEVESQDGGMLTLADNYYPGWHVFVDGEESPLLRTYTTLRGVEVGPGHHSVVFVFSSWMFWTLLSVSNSLLAVLTLAVSFVVVRAHWKQRGSSSALMKPNT